jgi:hypothetical protein
MAIDRLGLCLALERIAPSQYSKWNFNSMTKFGDKYIGANEDGIFIVDEADKDGDENIDARFRSALSDFSAINFKRIRRIYLGYETDGDLEARIGTDEKEDQVIEVPAKNRLLREHSKGFPVGRDMKGRYFDIEIRNLGGADFSMDEITLVPVILDPKPKD